MASTAPLASVKALLLLDEGRGKVSLSIWKSWTPHDGYSGVAPFPAVIEPPARARTKGDWPDMNVNRATRSLSSWPAYERERRVERLSSRKGRPETF